MCTTNFKEMNFSEVKIKGLACYNRTFGILNAITDNETKHV